MPIIIECHKLDGKNPSVCIGSMLCPNPSCKQAIYVDAIITSDNDNPVTHGSVDWDKVKENDSIWVEEVYYKVLFKEVKKQDFNKVFYLRPLDKEENKIVKINEYNKIGL